MRSQLSGRIFQPGFRRHHLINCGPDVRLRSPVPSARGKVDRPHVRVEPLSRLAENATYAEDELPREGLPCWSRNHFIATFLRRHRLKSADVEVTRIEFEHVEEAEP